MTADPADSDAVPPPIDWWWLGAGSLLIAVVAIALATRWDAIRASHPAYLVTALLVAVGGATMVWGGARRRGHRPAGGRRIAIRAALVLAVFVIGGIVWALRPVAATTVAIEAMLDGLDVEVASSATRIEMTPVGSTRRVGLVFYPGGLVDPRAYANVLRPIAAAGYPVIIVKPPYGFGFLAQGAAADVASAQDGSLTWAVGGHSLGGVAAASAAAAAPQLGGLVLWASFPAGSLADRVDLPATSVFGSNDALTTPEKVADSRFDMPASTRFVEIGGSVHAFFGDYGPQRGDGTPSVSREKAQEEIVRATLDSLADLEAAQT